MKGFAISPVVLLIVFVIVIALSFHVRQADSNSVRALSAEGEARKAMLAADKELSKATAVAFETLHSENKINPLADMEDEIEANLLARGMDASIKIGAGSNKTTRVDITPNNFGVQQGDSLVTLTSTSSFLLSHPFFQYSQVYENYDPNGAVNVCDYVTTNPCSFDEAGYEADKKVETALEWDLASSISCAIPGVNARLSFSAKLTDPDNYVTQSNPFELDNVNDKGSYSFTVDC